MVVSAVASLAVYFHGEDARTLATVLVGGAHGRTRSSRSCRLGDDRDRGAPRVRARGSGRSSSASRSTLLALMRRTLGRRRAGVVVLCLGLAWFADTGAYFAGRFLGKRKLYEAVSPKKTVEGAVGGLVGSVVGALLGRFWFLAGLLPLAPRGPAGHRRRGRSVRRATSASRCSSARPASRTRAASSPGTAASSTASTRCS